MSSAVPLISCPDRPGLVAGVANFVTGHGGDILHADQHDDDETGIFFQRVELALVVSDHADHAQAAGLDEGPIIEQDLVRISRRDTVDDLVGKSRDLEKVALARAIRSHVDHRVLVHGNETVVFA